MVWQLVVAGVSVFVGLKYLSESEKSHDEVVEETYNRLSEATPNDATVYADHLTHRSDVPNPDGKVDGVSKVPDVVVKSTQSNSLIVEVETADSLAERPAKAKAQLQDFSTAGYRRVLAVPEGKSDVEAVREFLGAIEDDLNGKIYLATPDDVTEFL